MTMKCLAIHLVCLLSLIMPRPGFAQNKAEISDIRLANTRDDLITYFNVKQAFTEKISQAVQNGVPTSFSFYVSLYQTSDSWLDKKIAEKKITSTLKYNSLTQEYTVSRPWKEEKPAATKSFEEAKSWMTEIDNLRVIPLENMTKGDKYQIRIKAELEKVTLPLSLHNIFIFVSFWDVKTDWYLVNFTY